MFFALNWFSKPTIFGALQTQLLNWARSGELVAFLVPDPANPPAAPEKRPLTEQEVEFVEIITPCAWQITEFGGYLTSENVGDIQGFCQFELDEARQRARLVAWLAKPGAEGQSLFRSEILQTTIKTMLNELRYIEMVQIPLLDVSDEDRAVMEGLELVPSNQPGWWQRTYRPDLAFPAVSPESVISWLEIRVPVKAEVSDLITRQIGRYSYDEHTFVDWIDGNENEPPERRKTRVVRGYIPFDDKAIPTIEKIRKVIRRLGQRDPIGGLEVVGRSWEEWNAIRSRVYPVIEAGESIVINPTTSQYRPEPDKMVVDIVPAPSVFGFFYSGLHPSTVIAMEFLERYVDPRAHKKMLDLGTGTGVQAIVAAKLGVERVLAVDAYSVAADSARDNVERNGLSDRITVERGSVGVVKNEGERGLYAFSEDAQQPPADLEKWLPFDLIMSNIIARGLIGLAPTLSDSLRPGGLLIASGISNDRQESVAAALQQNGLLMLDRRERNGWVSLVFIKR